jgi:5'-nucleotidase
MRILVSNDDGYFAPGIHAVVEALSAIAEVTVVAPERDRSGASNSLTLDRPLTIRRTDNGFYCVNGTPTDCVHLAVTGFLSELPDMVVSGINLGQNMGDDTLYSGTVAAATEGYLLGIPSVAVSLATRSTQYLPGAARMVRELIERFHRAPPSEPVLLNVNVPAAYYESFGAPEVTRLGKRHKAEPVIKTTSPRNETLYWVGAAGPAADAGPGTDFYAVAAGRVSVTPLQIDLTHREQLPLIREWLAR